MSVLVQGVVSCSVCRKGVVIHLLDWLIHFSTDVYQLPCTWFLSSCLEGNWPDISNGVRDIFTSVFTSDISCGYFHCSVHKELDVV